MDTKSQRNNLIKKKSTIDDKIKIQKCMDTKCAKV